MSEPILDLDDQSTWDPNIKKLIFDPLVWPKLIRLYRNACDFVSKIHDADPEDREPFLAELRESIDERVRNYYTSVYAYHQSRVFYKETFREKGILICSREHLESWVHSILAATPGLEEAMFAASSRYFPTYEGTVSLYLTTSFAPTLYLECNNYVRMVLNFLKLHGYDAATALHNIHRVTSPIIVKCSIPLEWLEDLKILRRNELSWYSAFIIECCLRKYLEVGEERRPQIANYALLIKRCIPPERVVKILDAEVREPAVRVPEKG